MIVSIQYTVFMIREDRLIGNRWTELCLGLALCAGLSVPTAAQIGGGALAGTVVDQGGAGVPGATVTITAVGTNLSRTVMTGADGGYLVTGLAPGPYRIRSRPERLPSPRPRGHWTTRRGRRCASTCCLSWVR